MAQSEVSSVYLGSKGIVFYKVELHLHTSQSDGRLSPSDAIDLYRGSGFDAVAITDHWKYSGERTEDGMLVISGCEYNVGGKRDAMHILGLGMSRDPEIERESDRQGIINGIRSVGGIAVLAHPAWSLNSLEETRRLSGLEATEIYNSVSECGESLRAYSDHFVDLCARHGLSFGILATDDAHYYGGVDDRRGWVMVRAQELTQSAIVEAIIKRDFYATQGPHLWVERVEDRIVIETSPCSVIAVLSDAAHIKGHTLRGKDLTHFEYPIHDEDGWIRVEARDERGLRAWSNIIALK